MKAGGLTAFCFHIIGKKKRLFGGEKKLKELPPVYIPVAECKAWGAELERRVARLNADQVSAEDETALDEADPESMTLTPISYITIRRTADAERFAMCRGCLHYRRVQMNEPGRLISLQAVGQMLGGVSVKTIRRKIAAGELSGTIYFGRKPMLSLSEVAAVIERLKQARRGKACV